MGFNPNPTGPELLEAAKAFLRAVNDSRQVLSQSSKGHERKAFREWQSEWHAAKDRLAAAVRAAGTGKVACPKCNGGLGYHKFGIDNPCQPCDLCDDTGEVTEADAQSWLDGQDD